MIPGFHAREGLYFTRTESGGVVVTITEEPKVDSPALKTIELTPEAWGSVVSSMSAAGENFETWTAAVAAQKGTQ
jgi:hypothetical protein